MLHDHAPLVKLPFPTQLLICRPRITLLHPLLRSAINDLRWSSIPAVCSLIPSTTFRILPGLLGSSSARRRTQYGDAQELRKNMDMFSQRACSSTYHERCMIAL